VGGLSPEANCNRFRNDGWRKEGLPVLHTAPHTIKEKFKAKSWRRGTVKGRSIGLCLVLLFFRRYLKYIRRQKETLVERAWIYRRKHTYLGNFLNRELKLKNHWNMSKELKHSFSCIQSINQNNLHLILSISFPLNDSSGLRFHYTVWVLHNDYQEQVSVVYRGLISVLPIQA